MLDQINSSLNRYQKHSADLQSDWLRISFHNYYGTLLFLFTAVTMTALNALRPRTALASVLDTGDGNATTQIIYIAILIITLVPLALRSPHSIFGSIPRSIWLLFLWCLITVAWSPAPDIALRRLAFTVVVSLTATSIAFQLPPRKVINILGNTLFLLVVLSLFSSAFIPELAIHQIGDPESGTVGAWRGLFYHKNTFGSVAALALLFSLHFVVTAKRNRWLRFAGVLVCLCALVLSGSRTSLLLALLCGALFFIFRWAIGRRQTRSLFWFMGILTVFVGAFVLVLGLAYGHGAVDRDQLLTGRGYIWSLIWQVFLANPVGGAGYQSIFQIGANTAFASLTSNTFFQTLAHAHNSYLEILASTGLIGFLMFSAGVIIYPCRQTITSPPEYNDIKALLLAVISFVLLHSILESGLVDRDRSTWVMMLIVLGCLTRISAEKKLLMDRDA